MAPFDGARRPGAAIKILTARLLGHFDGAYRLPSNRTRTSAPFRWFSDGFVGTSDGGMQVVLMEMSDVF